MLYSRTLKAFAIILVLLFTLSSSSSVIQFGELHESLIPYNSHFKNQVFVPRKQSKVNSDINLQVGSGPDGIAYNPFNTYMYVNNPDAAQEYAGASGNVSIINSRTNSIVHTVNVGFGPMGIAYDPYNTLIYVADYSGACHFLSVINSSTYAVSDIYLGSAGYPTEIAYDPVNHNIYVDEGSYNCFKGCSVAVINSSTNAVVDQIHVGADPAGIAFDPSNGEMYVTDYMSDEVSVINSTTNTVTKEILLSSPPDCVAYDPENQFMYVGFESIGGVSLINTSSNTVVGNITLNENPTGISYDPQNSYMYVEFLSKGVSIINSTTNEILKNITAGCDPRAIAYDPYNTYMYIVNEASNNITVLPSNKAFEATFDESGLSAGTNWYVNLTGEENISSGPINVNSYSLYLENGTYNYNIASSTSFFNANIEKGQFRISGLSYLLNITFIPVPIIKVESEFSGVLYSNVSLVDTFGVYSQWGLSFPSYVNGTIGNKNFTFVSPLDHAGFWNASIPVNNMSKHSTLNVIATYMNGSKLNSTYNFTVIPVPGEIMNLVANLDYVTTDKLTDMEWNNLYSINITTVLNFYSLTGIDIPLPVINGYYSLIPNVDIVFRLFSNETAVLNASFEASTPTISLGPVGITAHFSLSATGDLMLTNDTLQFSQACLLIKIGGSFSVTPPTIVGVNISGIPIGLTLNFKVSPNIAVKAIFAATSNSSREFINGIGLMVSNISSNISLSFTISASISATDILSGSLGGTLTVNLNLGTGGSLMKGGNITGVIFAAVNALTWSDSWNLIGPGVLYKWNESDPTSTQVNASGSFQLSSRYWNVSGYNSIVWNKGNFSGTVIHNIYPETSVSGSIIGNQSYFIYTYDNTSRNITQSLELRGFKLDNRSYSSFNIPLQANSISFSPQLISLENGSMFVIWDSMPINETSELPQLWSYVPIEYSYYNPTLKSWSSVTKLTNDCVAQSFFVSNKSGETIVASIVSPSTFSNYSFLKIYNIDSGSLSSEIKLPFLSSIVSFSAISSIAILKETNGSFVVLNISSGEFITLPKIQNYSISNVGVVNDSTSILYILYKSNLGSLIELYSLRNNVFIANFTINYNITTINLDNTKIGLVLVASTPNTIFIYKVRSNETFSLISHYQMFNEVSLGTIVSPEGLTIYSLCNYGNQSNYLLNLNVTFIPFHSPLPPVLTLTYIPGNKSLTLHWVDPYATSYYASGYLNDYYNGILISNISLYDVGSGNYTINSIISGNYRFDVVLENYFGANYSESTMTLYSVTFTADGLGSGVLWSLNVTKNAMFSSTNDTIKFLDPNGSYSFSISTPDKTYSPSPSYGRFDVNGSSDLIFVNFTEIKFNVQFIESGLPNGTLWSVNLDGYILSSSTNTITISLTNGSYSFSVERLPGYNVSNPNGSLTVYGVNITVSLVFSPLNITSHTPKETKPTQPSNIITYLILGTVAAVIVLTVLIIVLRRRRE